jgi:hypothetical protein
VPKTSAERVAAYRSRRREQNLPDTTRRNKRSENVAWKTRKAKSRPFVGCDGEGAGTDELGRQNYLLFRMGERELYTGSRLTTDELLEFICAQPPGGILVGFAFGYDVTMILRDLPDEQKRRLFEPKDFSPGHSPFVWYHEFDVDYLPKQYLKVRRVKRIRDPQTGQVRRVGVKGSTRIIYETFGFFQKSFLKVCKEFDVGSADQLATLDKNKSARGDDTWQISDEERAYCALECDLLAELMVKLREYCYAADIHPKSWNGAGKLAKALLAKHKAPTFAKINEWVPQEVRDLANMAYYGGRFEITRTGLIDGKIYESDIGSAYPDGMRHLPCLEHGTWTKAKPAELRAHTGLFVAAVTFNRQVEGDGRGQLGGFPIRSKEGHLYWPLRGGGIYWSPEIHSAERLGFNVRYKGGWLYHNHCDCKPFDWIEPLFDYRRSIGKSGPGYPIKLGVNSLYGAQAQRVGAGKYANMVYAGLTTALTRTRLNEAICAVGERNIVMLATDGVYSTIPIPGLDVGDRLGQWEVVELNGLFIVQPGLYWCPEKRKRKSRGLSGKFFEEPGRTEGFENAWSDYLAAQNSGLAVPFPSVSVPVPGFIGLRLAQARGKPELAGCWTNDYRSISFDYGNKRRGHVVAAGHIVTGIKPGSPGLVSLPHRDFLAAGGAEPWEAARLMLEEQPDYVDLGIPFKD